MALKKNEDGLNRSYWEFVERMAKEEDAQRPHWAVDPDSDSPEDPPARPELESEGGYTCPARDT